MKTVLGKYFFFGSLFCLSSSNSLNASQMRPLTKYKSILICYNSKNININSTSSAKILYGFIIKEEHKQISEKKSGQNHLFDFIIRYYNSLTRIIWRMTHVAMKKQLTELCTLLDQWINSTCTQKHQIQPIFGEFNLNHLDGDHISVTAIIMSYLLTSFVWCDGLSWSKSIMDHLWWKRGKGETPLINQVLYR